MHVGMMDKLMHKFSILIISAGVLLLAWGISPISSFHPSKAVSAAPVAVAQPTIKKKPVVSGIPTRIVIPGLGIDLPVELGAYDPATSSWTIANKKAFFANITALANDTAGSTLVYGHNNRSVFRALHAITGPTEAYIYTDNGYLFTYQFQAARIVDPADTSVFTYEGPPILTLQTCDGTWNEVRKLFTFTLKSMERI